VALNTKPPKTPGSAFMDIFFENPLIHSSDAVFCRSSSSLGLFLLRRSAGSSLISTPGPTVLEALARGQTFVPDQPNLNANSCASSSPKPSIIPLTKGRSRLIAAPLNIDHTVGGLYMMTGASPLLFDEDCGGEEDGGDSDEYGSESDGMVSCEAERS